MQLQFLGSGDAFGSGGRFNTCLHIRDERGAFLIDCGASSMIAIRKFAVDPNAIRTILISHLHGDHFAGLPFFILDAQLVSRRTEPLCVAGPPGLRERLERTMEALFPGSSNVRRDFALRVCELDPGKGEEIDGIEVQSFEVKHACGAPPLALRLKVDGKTLCYSGDTEWVDALLEAARDADLFIAEAYFSSRQVKYHLDYATLSRHLPQINAKRVILTHMSPEMLAWSQAGLPEMASDGMLVSI